MNTPWLVLTAVACGTFMATLDSSIVNIALHTLTQEFQVDLTRISWVIILYFLVITSLLLPFGRLSDQYGHRRIFLMGFYIFIAGSTICGISPSIGFLLVARIIQAIGASMLMANGPAIITAAFPAERRGMALGILAMVASIGLISGTGIGGLLISMVGWRFIFLVNIPIGIVGAYLVKKYVSEDVISSEEKSFDWIGAILQFLFLLLLSSLFETRIFPLSEKWLFTEYHVILLGILMVIGYLFFRFESKVPNPVIDLSIFNNLTFSTSNLAAFLIFIAYSSVAVLAPLYLESQMKYDTFTVGVLMMAIPATIFVIAPISGKLSDFIGSKEICVIGALVEAASLFYMGGMFSEGLTPQRSTLEITLALVGIGLGLGIFQSPNNNAIMGAVDSDKLGIGSACIATVRNLGLMMGAGIASGLYQWKLNLTSESASRATEALHFAFITSGVIAIGAMLSSFGKIRGPHWK